MEIGYVLTNVSFTDEGWKFIVPLVLMAIDFLTGIVHAWATSHLKSYKMREGLMKKFAEVSILIIGILFKYGLNLPAYVLSGFSIYIIFMELVSIFENLKKMGVPIPRFVERALGSMDKLNNSELTEDEIKRLSDTLKRGDKK